MKLGKSLATWVGAAAFAVCAAGIFGGVALRADNVNVGTEPPGIEINETNFPDETFREKVMQYDTSKDLILSEDEIKAVKELSLSYYYLTSLKGIEYFTSVEKLAFCSVKLELPDLSLFPKLVSLDCSQMELTSLDISANPELEELTCSYNGLVSLDVSNNPKLVMLDCSRNKLTNLVIGNNPDLKYLNCGSNQINVLDVSNCTNLRVLMCDDNELSKLDLSKNTQIIQLACEGNSKLASLDVRSIPEMVNLIKTSDRSYDYTVNDIICKIESTGTLYYPFNTGADISSMVRYISFSYTTKLVYKDTNVSSTPPVEGAILISEKNFPDEFFRDYVNKFDLNDDGYLSPKEIKKAKEIRCSSYPIKSMEGLQYFSSLTVLYCEYTKLSELNVSKNLALEILGCAGNGLKSLDVNQNTEMTILYCGQNKLEKLDLASNTKLTHLDCSLNDLSQIDTSANIGLVDLNCTQNKLTALDVSNNPDLVRLNCSENQIQSLDVGNSTNLHDLYCQYNKLTDLRVCGCPNLEHFACFFNNLTELDIRGCTNTIKIYKTGRHDGGEYVISDPFMTFHLDESVKVITDGIAPTPTPKASSGNASIGDFAERLYTVALGRSAEKDGKDYWVTEIKNGKKTGADSALFFLTGPEFKGRGLSIEEFVETLYQTFFGRASEATGKAYWVGELKNYRKSREDVIRGFIDSTEWCNICAEYGVLPGAPSAKANKASQAASGFATRLYTCCLKRDPEKKGLDYWSLALTNREQTGSQAAKLFFESEEFKNLKTSNTEYVTRLYKTFMDRDPEADGLSYWVGELAANRKTRAEVLSGFASSKEFTNICKSYGIERGTI